MAKRKKSKPLEEVLRSSDKIRAMLNQPNIDPADVMVIIGMLLVITGNSARGGRPS